LIGGVGPVMVKKKKKAVSFNEEEDIINPEDIDPSVGRFRNMIQTVVVIPNKVRDFYFSFDFFKCRTFISQLS
jgi:hypothetical protein